uniref:Uncharacterized protein n=1 Tax=Arundo donax TaxID=35708 RepID=A0A0A9BID2_ARUDO
MIGPVSWLGLIWSSPVWQSCSCLLGHGHWRVVSGSSSRVLQ